MNDPNASELPAANNFFTTISTSIDRLTGAIGRATAWMTLAMVLVIFAIVVLRYAFDSGPIWLQEVLIWLHATAFMAGMAYTLQREEHVRVDVFYRNMSARRRALVNAFGVLFFLLPLCVFLLIEGLDYVMASWAIQEVSIETGGLPYPFLPLLKSMLLLMPALLALQAVSLLLRSLAQIKNGGEN